MYRKQQYILYNFERHKKIKRKRKLT